MTMDDYLIVEIGHALGCAVRFRILRILGETGLSPTQAARIVGVTPATAHRHLGVLVRAGLVERKGRRRGCRYRWPRHRWELVCRDTAEEEHQGVPESAGP